jgi:DNA-binding NarL/FixJ family response regulator
VTALQTIRVAIVDDNRLVREALSSMLARLPDISPAPTGDPMLMRVTDERPDVVLLDVGLRDQDSLATAVSLMKEMPFTKVIVMDVLPVNEEIVEFVNAGVSGFVLKDASFEELVTTIRQVAGGGKVLPVRMTETLFAQIAREAVHHRAEQVIDDVRLTRREREVIDLIGEGLSNKEIAQRLNIAVHTVKSHVRNVMEKLTLHTRLQISAYHHREGRG